MTMIENNKMERMGKKEELIELLKKDTDGLTIVEIARKLGISRNTTAVAIAELKGEGKLRIRPVGVAKLHYLKKRGEK